MNTNRDASQRTMYNRAKVLASYNQTMKKNINSGTILIAPAGGPSDLTASIHTEVIVGQTKCCIPENPTSISSGPTYETFYVDFTTVGATTWTAPATIQSPITYWIVGGGGGGGGAHDGGGAGGGGGGVVITGTYSVVAGTTYDIVVGVGGAGGTGVTGNVTPETDGTDGSDSSFNAGGGGPVAAGGGGGFKSRALPQNGDGGAAASAGSGGIGGNSGSTSRAGGGGGGASGSGTNGTVGTPGTAGTGGAGISFTIPGYNGGNAQVYGEGGNGGRNRILAVGASGSANTGKGGGGGGATFGNPATSITMGGAGGSGLVVIQYSA